MIFKAKGITICDCDVEQGTFTPRKEVEIGNPSYMRLANHSDFLYSVSDLGISSFKILPDGDLEFINKAEYELQPPPPPPPPNEAEEVYYRNCKEVWQAGKAPIREGDPGFRPQFDGDKDGVGCEVPQ